MREGEGIGELLDDVVDSRKNNVAWMVRDGKVEWKRWGCDRGGAVMKTTR